MLEGRIPAETPQAAPVPRFLVELPSWPRVFFGNLRDLLFPRRQPRLELRSAPAAFWPDVFVKRGLPWRRFAQSSAYHLAAFVLFISASRFFALHPQPAPKPIFDHTQVVYYSPPEYLPPLDTRMPHEAQTKRADAEFSSQPIISVPPEADNRRQTIVAPPAIKLKRDIALPNIVAWPSLASPEKAEMPKPAIPPVPLIPAAEITRIAPRMESPVVRPPPDAAQLAHRRDSVSLRAQVVAPPPVLRASSAAQFEAPQPAVIAPPPVVKEAAPRRPGELNVGPSAVIAPAPRLAVEEQQVVSGGRSPAVTGVVPRVIAPPPSLLASGSSGESAGSGNRVIALSLHPAVSAPPDPPAGNRRGAFAATPEGHAGASGAPGSSSSGGAAAGNGSGSESGSRSRRGADDPPAGLYVGSPPATVKSSPVAADPAVAKAEARTAIAHLAASVPPVRVSSTPAHPMQPDSTSKLSDAERAVFGNRKYYSLTLNMPNLNSAGGSWVIRFAELRQEASSPTAEVSQPSATRKVDPGYPLQLMRQNVAGTVVVYAVIDSGGRVGNVRVLEGVDDRLDQFAREAVAKWQFEPATKNGVPIAVEATFQIPFRPPKRNY